MTGNVLSDIPIIVGKVSLANLYVVGKLRSENLHILGVVGMPKTIGGELYDGDYVIIPKISEQSLSTSGKTLKDDVLIKEIPSYEVENEFGGVTFIIGG